MYRTALYGLLILVAISPLSMGGVGDALSLLNRGSVHVPGGVEIASFDPQSGHIYAIGEQGLMVFEFDELNRFSIIHSSTYSNTERWQATSIVVDSVGRGFVACSWIPEPSDRVPGMVQILDTQTNTVVWQMSIGYHPDCLAMSPDGRYLIAANEGEPGIGDQPGAITIIDLSDIKQASDFAGLNDVRTFGFTDEFLGEGVRLDVLRVTDALRDTPEVDIEPEYLAASNEGVWVGLQENNGLAYFDFALEQWTRVQSLGKLSQAFDANDEDGVSITTQIGFGLLPQPDTIALTAIDGRSYIVLANEGEKADADTIRFSDAILQGLMDPVALEGIRASYSLDAFLKLGRLWISTIDGDLDGDGDIDLPSALGGRSASIIDADTGAMVWNSGAQFEQISARLWEDAYNDHDTRSDRSGPEPEGIAVGQVGQGNDARTLMFVGLERTGALMMYDISDPVSAMFLDAQLLDAACVRPEGLVFFSLYERDFIGVASEKGGCLTVFEIASAP